MNDATYLWLNDAQAGPFTALQLRSMWTAGTITAATLCWQKGMEEWTPVGTSIEDAMDPKQVPPPRLLAVTVPVVRTVSQQVATTKPTNDGMILWMILLGGIVLIGLVFLAAYGEGQGWWNLPTFDFLPHLPSGIMLLGICLYFLPTLITPKGPWLPWIFLLNLLLGWTGIVWIACIVAAICAPRLRST